MINLQTITNVSDCVPLYLPHSLYLKPLAKLSISVGLPPNKMGKSISNFDIMDKLTKALAPDKFLVLKVSKSTLEVIRLEAELEEPSRLQSALARLDGMSFKVNGFTEYFKVRAKETKDEFPNRHDWDIFFRDAHYMDEMKAGERPDTIHFANLPIRWFCPRHMENDDNVKPSESIFKRIFEKFGVVRAVDIPVCDAFRQKISSDVNGINIHNFEQDLFFEGYVQFEEYIGFVRAMDEFRGMKLVRKFVDKTQAVNVIVNFDKRKHLSDASVLRRERMRKSLLAKVKAREEEEELQKKKEQEKLERERKLAEEIKLKELERQREREEQRKKKHLKKLEEKGQIEISRKIRLEEKKLLIVRRKLESIRVLEALFERLKLKDNQEKGKSTAQPSIDLRQRLVDKYKSATEKLLDEQKRKLESEKLQTGLLGLLKHRKGENIHSDENSANGNAKSNGKRKKKTESSDSSSSSAEDEGRKKVNDVARADQVFNPFKDVYTPETAAELMKMSMLSYGVFPGVPVYRPSFHPAHSMRGYIPRGRGGPPRGPRRGGYNYHGSSGYTPYNYYNDYNNGGGMSSDYHERYGGDYKQSRSYTRSRSRKRSRSRTRTRSRSRSHSRSRSRTRSRHRRYSRSRRSRHRSNTRSHSRSRSRSPSRSHRSRAKERSRSRSRSQSRIRENRSRTRSRSLSKPKTHSNRERSESKTKSGRARTHSRSKSRNHRTRSKTRSKSQTRSKRSRSVSKSKAASTRVHSRSRSQSKKKAKVAGLAQSTSRERAQSKSRSDSKPKSSKHHSRSNSEHKSKSHKARSRSRSSSKNKSTSKKLSKKLVSTRRSRSQLSWSRSPSEPRRSWSQGGDA